MPADASRVEVDTADLELVGVRDLGPEADADFAEFDSGDADRNQFLIADGRRLDGAGVVRTFVGYHRVHGLVGYVALLADVITLQTGERKKTKPLGHGDHPRVPAVKVAHVAVSLAHSKTFRGTGTALMGFAVAAADGVAGHVGCRLLTLDAVPSKVDFYRKLGFVQNKSETGGVTPTTTSMRVDLRAHPAPSWFPPAPPAPVRTTRAAPGFSNEQ